MRTGVTLIHASHADMSASIPVQFHGKVRACMFNLGYLPGGDKRLVTHVDSTLAALTCAARILATGGILTVIAYPGHPGGEQETTQVKHWCGQLDAGQFNVKTAYRLFNKQIMSICFSLPLQIATTRGQSAIIALPFSPVYRRTPHVRI